MFSNTGGFGNTGTSLFGASNVATTPTNPNKDYEMPSPPDDTVQTLRFSPASVQQNFLASGSWDGLVRLWEVSIPPVQQMINSTTQQVPNIQAMPKAQQTAGGPVMDLSYSDVSSLCYAVFNFSSISGIIRWEDRDSLYFFYRLLTLKAVAWSVDRLIDWFAIFNYKCGWLIDCQKLFSVSSLHFRYFQRLINFALFCFVGRKQDFFRLNG